MRIPEPTGQFGDAKGPVGKAKRSSDKGAARHVSRDSVNELNFLKELDNAAEEQVKRSLDELIEDLTDQAQVLEKRRTFEELDKYKKMVKVFMQTAIQKIYSVKVSDSSKLMSKRKKVYILVERVDAELEQLTKQILDRQAAGLDLLAVLERIKGILVDMYS
jgi:uncharacterized protein YaaR (DUF327 family)